MIYYYCPDLHERSGGLRRIYRHVDILNRHNVPVFVLHNKNGFTCPDMPSVPIRYLENGPPLKSGDIVVIPESYVKVMAALRDVPVRRFVMALSWKYIFHNLVAGQNWRTFNIERVITVIPFIADYVTWSMNLPSHVLAFSVDPKLYYAPSTPKQKQIAFFAKKSSCIHSLHRSLISRNPEFGNSIVWKPLHRLTEAEYADELRKSTLFLALGMEEGLNRTIFEAMACATIVAGFHGGGPQHLLVDEGENANFVLAPNGDYVSLAYLLEPLLLDIIEGDLAKWDKFIRNGLELTSRFTPEAEERSVLDFWKEMLASGA